MSIRAYKIKEIVTEENPTFNCGRDEDIFNMADISLYDNGGILTIYEKDVKNKLKKEKDKENIKILKQILKDIPKREDFVEYFCY